MASAAKTRDFADIDDDNVIRDVIGKARTPDAPEPPRALRRPLRDAEPFPVGALGDGIRAAVEAAAAIIEAPVEICAQSALANAALAIQGHANVVLPIGQSRPLSLFLVSIAASGDRKSAADSELGWAIERHERNLADALTLDNASYANDVEAWKEARSAAKVEAKGGTRESIAAALEAAGAEPTPPLQAIIAFPEPTLEGMQKYLAVGQPSIGLFSDEGGMFVGGVGMSKENALKTAAGLSKFWDGSPVRRVRAGDGSSFLMGRRVSLHLMLQPDAAMTWMGDPVLKDQGLFSRMLVVAPRSLAGTRFSRGASPEARKTVNAFGARLLAILERPCPIREGTRGELAPRDLPMSDRGTALWWEFRDAIEREVGECGKLLPVRSLACKIYEHAARLAGVVALFDNLDAPEIDAAAMARGITLANWYLGESLRLAEVGVVSDDVRLGEALLTWLRDTWPHLATDGGKLVSPPDIYQRGPTNIREKAVAMRAIEVLLDHGWLVKVEGGAKVNGIRRRDAYAMVEVA